MQQFSLILSIFTFIKVSSTQNHLLRDIIHFFNDLIFTPKSKMFVYKLTLTHYVFTEIV